MLTSLFSIPYSFFLFFLVDIPIKQPCEEDYETIKLISNGAYGGVYLVRHKETRQKFAMKKIDKQSLILRNQVEQAFAERDIMSFTDNPFVVSLYCSFEAKRFLCLVMEYVEGGDLATLLKNMGPLPVDLARFYFAETVLAVEYLHNHGIVHRDLKPENLLITALGHIKLTDFGLSKIGLMNLATNMCEEHLNKREKETKEFTDNSVCGTPEYIAPEVISRQGYGKPVDWWSMGITLYELLIGCVPFFGETPEELFAHVINDEITWPEEDDWPLPEDAKDIITKLLKQNPVERLGTGGAYEVKEHSFFDSINWDDLLRQKAEFVPQLDNDEDTSYFDTRTDRYNHEIDDSEELDDTDESSSSMFSSFSSCSPKYHRVYSRIEQELAQEKLLKSASTSSILDESVQTTSTMNDSFLNSLDVSIENHPVDRPSTSSVAAKVVPQDVSEENVTSSGNKETNETISTKDKPVSQSTPDSSQTESEDFSPKVVRRRKPCMSIKLSNIPRFSISNEADSKTDTVDERIQLASQSSEKDETKGGNVNARKSQIPRSSQTTIQLNVNKNHHSPHQSKGRAVIKSASATGLSLVIPDDDGRLHKCGNAIVSSGGSSTSSRDASPNRDILNPLGQQLKPPIIVRRGPRGFGFTLRAIRVYYGDSDVYTVHHLVLAVENNSPAFEAGLRPNALITHINGELIQGLLHHQVLQLVLSGGDKINIRTTPLENTTIRTGGRRRNPSTVRMTRRPNLISHKKSASVKRTDSDKRRRSSLLRRLNSKRASAEIQQIMASSGPCSPPLLAPSRSFQSLNANRTSIETNTEISSSLSPSSNIPRYPRSPPPNRLNCSDSSVANSSQSSSPSSSLPNSPASLRHFPHFPRPSTLSGLKQHKTVKSLRSPRRKSCGHIPLSPLARTPSPSLQSVQSNPLNYSSLVATSSPTRISSNTSPGIHRDSENLHHPPGSSQKTQSFVIVNNKLTDTLSSNSSPVTVHSPTIEVSSSQSNSPKSSSRPRSAEPNSIQPPLFLRRTLSPDRILLRGIDSSVQQSRSPAPIRYKRHSFGSFPSHPHSPLATSSLPPSSSPNKIKLPGDSDRRSQPLIDVQKLEKDKSINSEFLSSPSRSDEACSSDDSTEKISQILQDKKLENTETEISSSLDDSSRCKRDLSSDDSINSSQNNDSFLRKSPLDKNPRDKKFLSNPESK